MRKLIGLLMLVCAGSVNAATAVMSGGQLIGATGIEVNGASYDVAFLDGSCNSLYNGCTGLPFTTSSESLAASQALLDQVIQPQGINHDNSYLINGIDMLDSNSWSVALIMTPVTESSGGASTYNVRSVALISPSLAGLISVADLTAGGLPSPFYGKASDESSFTSPTSVQIAEVDEVYAVWTPAAVSAVPLPAAAWLFISAIAGLAGAKRLSRSKGSA
jgi:hypothetical protein